MVMSSSASDSARDDCESFACNMKESLSSSTPRSGDVEDDDELEASERLCWRLARAMVVLACSSVGCEVAVS